jgi:PAS domain S-box-containing protein
LKSLEISKPTSVFTRYICRCLALTSMLLHSIWSCYSQRHSLEQLRFEAREMAPLLQTSQVEMGRSKPGRSSHIAEAKACIDMRKPEYALEEFLCYASLPTVDQWGYGGLPAALTLALAAGLIAARCLRLSRALKRAIANHEQVEESLLESEQSYRNQFAGNSTAMLLYDPDNGGILDANEAALSFYGYARERFLAMSLTNINIPPESEDRQIMPQIPQEHGKRMECRHRLADASVREVEVSLSRVRFSGRIVIHLIIQDITEHKRIATEVRKLSQAVEQTPASVVITDHAGDIQYVNPAFVEMTGYTLSEALGKNPRILKSGTMPSEIYAEMWRKLKDGQIWRGELQNRRKDGNLFWEWAVISQVKDTSDKVTHYVAIKENITERKRVEEERKKLETQNRQLQKSESLGRMAGAIAHHFNNLLMAVMGNLELAMIGMPPGIAPAKNLTGAMQAARKAAEVSGLMLTYLGNAPGKRESLDLSDVCSQGLAPIRATMPHNVILKANLPSPGPSITATLSQILQVLNNLTANAVEACGEEQGITHLTVKTISREDIVTSSRFPIDWQPQDDFYACLEVADTGQGIADGDIEKLFDPFFSSKFTGRGMGLAVVLGIVRAHDGAVTVASELGRGSIFQVFLPVSAEAMIQKSAQKTGGINMAPLVVDETSLRKVVAHANNGIGFTVPDAQDDIDTNERNYETPEK